MKSKTYYLYGRKLNVAFENLKKTWKMDESVRNKDQLSTRKRSGMAYPLHVQDLERHLDLNVFIDQLDAMFAEPLELPSTADVPSTSTHSFSNVWPDDRSRKQDLSALYNFSTIGKRKWLKNILLEDSDSNSDSEEQITDADIKVLLKIHKYRRKYQKRYHTDIENSQYTYYAAGLLSEQDRHPQHQRYILDQYGFSVPEPIKPDPIVNLPISPPLLPVALSQPPKKVSSSTKRRKSSTGIPSNSVSRSNSLSFSSNVEQQQQQHSNIYNLERPTPKKSKTAKSPSAAMTPIVTCTSAVVTHSQSVESGVRNNNNEKYANFNVSPSFFSSSVAQSQAYSSVEAKPVGMDPSLKALWKTIVSEDIPKIAMSCASFLQQAKSGSVPSKNKSRQRKQNKNEPMGLRPVFSPTKPTPPNSSSSSIS